MEGNACYGQAQVSLTAPVWEAACYFYSHPFTHLPHLHTTKGKHFYWVLLYPSKVLYANVNVICHVHFYSPAFYHMCGLNSLSCTR